MITNFKLFENNEYINYRLGLESDLKDIKKITNKLRKELGFVMNVALIDAIQHDELYVAELNNIIIGFVHFHKRKDGWNTIHEIGVDPNYQGKGIGKYLFNMVPKPRRLKTTTDNNQSNNFYKYQGLKNIGTEQGRKRELNIWTDIKENKENNELSGKHSFMTFLQVISNHDYHFILNESYTKLYNYHFLFSTETIKDVEDYVEIFKYKQSLPLAYKALQNIKGSKLSFFFGIKDNSLLRYGFIDLDTQRSYIIGEFQVSGAYFSSISKYKAIQTINKILQNTDVKNLSYLSKIKQDFEKFYTSKKNSKIIINNNQVINYFDKTEFTDDDIRMNRPYRVLDQWISKKSWRNKVEYSVDDTTDQIQFIILVK